MFMDPETQARYAHNGKAMLGSAILLFLIIFIIIFLHTYRYSCFRRRRHRTQTNSTSAFNKALPLSLLNFLPNFTYSSATHRPLHDCAVCLSEFADGVEGRILPNCNHAFHSHCIDAWFRSHSNCPLCRTPVHQHAAPVQPPPTASSDIGPGRMGCSSLPAPIGCPRKPLEVVGIKLELEDKRLRGTEPDSGPVLGYHGFEGSDNRIPSLKRF